MSDDSEAITAVCRNCGNEHKHQLGWFRARLGIQGLICADCGADVGYTAEELELVVRNQRAGIFSKLRLN